MNKTHYPDFINMVKVFYKAEIKIVPNIKL